MKIDLAKSEIIHFVGIGGIGMSGLALIMHGMGFQIQGSDISSNKNKENLKSFYEKNQIKYELFNFKKNIFKNANEINFCITRAGASSLAELVQINLPFVAIPFPYAKDNHQYYNALYYKKLNCCWMIEQNSNISKDLFNLIYSFFENKNDLNEKINAMKKITYENSWNNINQKIIDCINEN